jgi:hypothetical protein
MSTTFDQLNNPYASPRLESSTAAQPQTVAAKPGSVVIILLGLVLVLVGYLASNLFMISNLYQVGFGPDGQVVPSPFVAAGTTPLVQWLIYAAFAAAFVGGAVMIGSQPFNPMAIVCYMMCPLVSLIFIVGWPLRVVRRYVEAVAGFYLLVGSALVFTGATRMFLLYGKAAGDSFEPVAASMMTQAGLALVVGAMVKFALNGSPTAAASAKTVAAAN